jgi:hypothetical protein
MPPLYQPRTFLLLDDSETAAEAKSILHSPLALAKDIANRLFQNDFEALKNDLDIIKGFVAGVSRAQSLSRNYSLARYYTLLFPFHQYFHSSYRARQGKVLEEILKRLLRNHTRFSQIPDKTKDKKAIVRQLFPDGRLADHDMDVIGADPVSGKTIIIQLRSRDDTGGTTAKGSLVDLLRSLLRLNKKPHGQLLYLVCIWDERDAQQRNSTIEKIYASLRDLTDLDRDAFEKIGKGIQVTADIKLQMAYGTDEILKSIFKWSGENSSVGKKYFDDLIEAASTWDDLWIAYAVASLELDAYSLRGRSNAAILQQKLGEQELALDFSSRKKLHKSIDAVTQRLVAIWDEDSLPVRTPSDQALYIRDLLFLKAICDTPVAPVKKKPHAIL